jgi:hypothetical protein
MFKAFLPIISRPFYPKAGLGCTYIFPEDLIGTNWFYTWGRRSSDPNCIPMSWAGEQIRLPDGYGGYLLAFNEPDDSSQANLSVDRAAYLYGQLVQMYPAARIVLGNTTQNGIGWLRSLRDKISVQPYAWGIHAYTGSATEPWYVQGKIEAVHAELGGSLWITEWADIHGVIEHDQSMFDWLNSTEWIERWAYFTNRASGQESWWIPGWKPQLWNMDGTITEVGDWWKSVIGY